MLGVDWRLMDLHRLPITSVDSSSVLQNRVWLQQLASLKPWLGLIFQWCARLRYGPAEAVAGGSPGTENSPSNRMANRACRAWGPRLAQPKVSAADI